MMNRTAHVEVQPGFAWLYPLDSFSLVDDDGRDDEEYFEYTSEDLAESWQPEWYASWSMTIPYEGEWASRETELFYFDWLRDPNFKCSVFREHCTNLVSSWRDPKKSYPEYLRPLLRRILFSTMAHDDIHQYARMVVDGLRDVNIWLIESLTEMVKTMMEQPDPSKVMLCKILTSLIQEIVDAACVAAWGMVAGAIGSAAEKVFVKEIGDLVRSDVTKVDEKLNIMIVGPEKLTGYKNFWQIGAHLSSSFMEAGIGGSLGGDGNPVCSGFGGNHIDGSQQNVEKLSKTIRKQFGQILDEVRGAYQDFFYKGAQREPGTPSMTARSF